MWVLTLKPQLFVLLLLSFMSCLKCDFEIKSTTKMYSLDGMSRSLLDLNKAPKVPCDSHANCSARLLTLDTYCCQSTDHCCNWFQFATTYKSAETVVPMKAPSILTILAIALLIICFLFVSYCFSILFCFCFKCGIFKRPKVILMHRSMANSESGLFTGSGNNSPKHSASTTSSSSSSSSYCSPNRRHYRQISSNKHQRSGHKKTNNKPRAHRSTRSPTARANRPQYDAEIYVDFDCNQNTDSPFLIPPELNDQVQERLQRSAQPTSQLSSSDTNQNTVTTTTASPSAPLADLDTQETVNETAATSTNRNLREPILVSSLSTSTTSSLGFGASLAEAIAASELESQQAQQSSVAPVDAILTSVSNFHYPDEQPPSYDEIIKNRKY